MPEQASTTAASSSACAHSWPCPPKAIRRCASRSWNAIAFFLDRGRNHNPLVGGSNQPTATIPICLMKNIIDDVVINDGIGFAILRLVAVPISSGTGRSQIASRFSRTSSSTKQDTSDHTISS